MKPKNLSYAKSSLVATLASVITLSVAGYSKAAELNWNTTTGDFSTAANWLVGAGPGTAVPGTLDNANIANGGTSQYTSGTAITVAEVRAGNGAAGTLEISGGGTFNSTGSTWVGRQSGSATGTLTVSGAGTIYNVNGGNTLVGAGVAGTGTAAGGSTGILNINSGAVFNHNPTGADTFRIGDTQGVAGNSGTYGGTLNVNGGTLKLPSAAFYVGVNNVGGSGLGFVNLSSGAITVTNNGVGIGRAGGTGTLNVTGGTFTKSGINNFVVGGLAGATTPTVGTVTQSGGTVAVTGGEFYIGNSVTTSATTVTGTYNLSGTGAVNVNNWIAVGRAGATGTLNITGGTVIKTGTADNGLTIGNGSLANQGTVNVSGGLLDVQLGPVYVGEGSVATLNISASGEVRTPALQVARTNTTYLGLVNLSGGTLKTSRIFGGAGNSEVDFNGTLIQATSNQTLFLDNLDVATIKAGGAIIDSNGFNLGTGVGQIIDGTGPLTKQGLGTLSLLGANTYTGPTLVSGGKLVVTTASYAANGPVTVAAGAGYGVNVLVPGENIVPSSLTLGASSGVDIDLGGNGNTGNAAIEVVGALTINSGAATIPINLSGSNFSTGQFPVIHYGSLTGTGNFNSFKVGTLPLGVTGTLVNNTKDNTIDLKITVKSPVWTGAVSGAWNTTTANWMDASSLLASTFADGDPVLFPDYAPDSTPVVNYDVTLASGVTVKPGALVQFKNAEFDYTLSGAGKISNPTAGTVGLTKQGAAKVTISTVNDFTGTTRVEAGTLSVPTLANGGVASPIGASAAASSSLALAGGILSYTGGTTSINRGFTVAGVDGGIEVAEETANLTFSGALASSAGGLVKKGPGTLTLTGTGTNVIAATNPTRVEAGKLVLNGTGTTPGQVIQSAGIWVGSTTAASAALDIISTTFNASTWMAIGRGNGNTENVSTVNITGSTMNLVNLTTGFANGLPNLSTQNLNIANSTVSNTGATLFAENRGSTTNVTLTGNAVLNTREIQLALGGGVPIGASSATLTVCDNSVVNVGSSTVLSYASIGRDGGTGNLIVKNSGAFLNFDDFSLGEAGTSTGTVTLQDSGVITVRTPLLARGAGSTALITQTGGTFSNFGDNNLQLGVNGNGTWNLSGGTVNGYGWNAIGRYAGSTTSSLNISGGTWNQVTGDRGLIIGEEGTATLNLGATGTVNVNGSFRVGFAATGVGTFNQTGGVISIKNNVLLAERGNATATLSAGQLSMNTGTGSFNFVVGNFDNGKATLNISGTADVRLTRNASLFVGNTSTTASNTVNQTGGTVTGYSDAGTTVGGTGVVRLGNGTASGTNTYNLRGGTLAIGGITSGTTAGVSTSVLNLGGGTLKAVRDNAAFISNITVASVEAAGVVIDTGTFNVSVTSALQDAGGGGGITKNGAGTLTFAGQNTYLGNTTINAGGITLADDARLRFLIGANGVTNRLTGTGAATLDGDFNIELGGAALANGNSWTLVDGSVNKSYGATFSVIGFTESGDVWTKVDGAKTWTFTEATGVLTLGMGAGNAYDSWISSYFPGVTDPNIIGSSKDPDGDGSSNALEFALGGAPNSGSSGPKVYALQEDTALDGDSDKEQLLTIAVRTSTPAFDTATSPSAMTGDSLTVYTIQGSLDLGTFDSKVKPVTPAVTTNLPSAPDGYEYRTFSLGSSNGLAGKGFLRVKVN